MSLNLLILNKDSFPYNFSSCQKVEQQIESKMTALHLMILNFFFSLEIQVFIPLELSDIHL